MARKKHKLTPFAAEMELIDASTDGRAVAKHEGKVVFVERGVPGDIGQVHVYGKQKSFLLGRLESLVEPSSYRTEPICQHVALCGGCKWQHMSYEGQLTFKHNQVINTLKRIGKVPLGEVMPILGAPEPYYYRNKLEFSFSTKAFLPKDLVARGEPVDQRVLGFHSSRIFDKIIDIETCHLQEERVNAIRNHLRAFARQENIPFYDIRQHEGYLRNLIFRSSLYSGELMLILSVAQDEPAWIDLIFNELATAFPEITHFVWILNQKGNSAYNDLPYQIWRGQPYLTEKLGAYQFRIRPTSFFQTNPAQAARLYQVVFDLLVKIKADGHSLETLYDLYAGTGSIGIFVSTLVQKIVGIEYVQSAVDDAWENVRLNELAEDRFQFLAGDMKLVLSEALVQKEGSPDVIIADPPRQGMDPKVVRQILTILPPHIIYVSCKPATQARDIHMMHPYYEVKQVQPVDMFPQTAHVENVVWLTRRDEPLLDELEAAAQSMDARTMKKIQILPGLAAKETDEASRGR